MTIKTKFNIGDKVFTINTNTLKVYGFEVKRISAYTEGNGVIVTLYDDVSYTANNFNEDKCFATEPELMTFITRDDAKAL